jgi:hypothetical protein
VTLQLVKGSNLIKSAVSEPSSFVGRLGSTEYWVLEKNGYLNGVEAEDVSLREGISVPSRRTVARTAWTSAGIWPPTIGQQVSFCNEYLSALKETTVMASWGNPTVMPKEAGILKTFCPDSKIINSACLDAVWISNNGVSPWTMQLRGRKVLVVHQFDSLINEQYRKREFLHKVEVLPEFELFTYRPPSTQGLNPFSRSWSYNLEKSREELGKLIEEFKIEVALVSAGAYGMPLSHNLKKSGISTVYVGGSLQILFGIWGGRWFQRPEYQDYSTESWVWPDSNRRPFGYKVVEKSSYW